MKTLILLVITFLSLFIVTTAVQAAEMEVQVNTDFVNLHSGPGRGYPIVQVAVKREALTILSKRTDWVQVRFKQQRYWLARADLVHLYTATNQQFTLSDDKQQQFQQRKVEAGLMFGDFNGSSFYQLSLAYLFSPYIHTELALGQANGDQADNLSAEFSLYLNPLPQWTVSPYFGLGGGVLRTNPRTVLVQTPDRNNSLASVELGLRYYLSRNVLARVGYRRSVIVTDRNENEEIDTWKLGFSVFF